MQNAAATTDNKPVRITVQPIEGYVLELLPGEFTGNWRDAMAWAKEQGGELPTRAEQTLLFQHARNEFKRDLYWSGEQHADDSAYAWYQIFYHGYQYYDLKGDKLRARAVRRLPI